MCYKGAVFGLLCGVAAWLVLHFSGLAVSGLSREVFWGLLAGQAIFFSNAGAGAMLLLLLFYLYVRPAGPAGPAMLASRFFAGGLFAAASCLFAGALFMFASLGQPRLILNLVLHPSPAAPFGWLALLLPLCLLLCAALGRTGLKRWCLQLPLPGGWRAPLLLGLGLALAFLLAQALYFQSFPGRGYWQNAGLSVRFWASACGAGAALLLLVNRAAKAEQVGRSERNEREAQGPDRFLTAALGLALSLNLLFYGLELFAAFYGGDVWLARSYQALFLGLGGRVHWFNFLAWFTAVLGLGATTLFFLPAARRSRSLLPLILGMLLLAGWLDKSLALPLGGQLPLATGSSLYTPSLVELFLSLGVWSAAWLLYGLLNRQPVARY